MSVCAMACASLPVCQMYGSKEKSRLGNKRGKDGEEWERKGTRMMQQQHWKEGTRDGRRQFVNRDEITIPLLSKHRWGIKM